VPAGGVLQSRENVRAALSHVPVLSGDGPLRQLEIDSPEAVHSS